MFSSAPHRCRPLVALGLGLFIAGTAHAFDLMEAYQLATTNDPNYLAALATAEAAREAIPQARAGLLPQISANINRGKNNTEQTTQSLLGQDVSRQYDYRSLNAALTLRQPIVRMGNLAHYHQAHAQVAAAEATLEKDTQALALRAAGAYFDTLTAREKLDSLRAQKEAYAGQLAAAEQAFRSGFGVRTDIDDARARLDLTGAQEIEARHALVVAERTLAGIIHRRVPVESMARLAPSRMPLTPPQPGNLDAWLTRAEELNPELRAVRANIEVAEREIEKGRAGHLPTLDLVASRSKSDSDSNNTIGSQYLTSSIGLQLSIPIYAGGQVNSAVRQAVANLEKARQQYEAGRRQLEVIVAKEYGGVEQGVARVQALELARQSAELAVDSNRKGVQAGTRNSVDVLNALQQLASTRLELAQARASYAMSKLRLQNAAGLLAESDIAEVNRWLAPATP